MRIPGMTLRQSHLNAYGAGGLELLPGHRHAGCPYLYREKYEKTPLPPVRKWQLDYGLTIHEALFLMEEDGMTPDEALKQAWIVGLDIARFDEALIDMRNTIEKGGILPMLSTLAVEEEISIPLYEDEDFGPVQIGGRLDGLWVNAMEPTTLVVGDYKTDRSPPSMEKLKTWTQGRHYGVLARGKIEKYLPGADRVVVLYEAVKWSTMAIEYTDEELDAYMAWAEAVARTILRDKTGKPKLNPNCSWCDVRQQCPVWKKLPAAGVTLAEKIAGVPLEEQVLMLDQVKEAKKFLTKQVEDVNAALIEYVDAQGPFESEELEREWYLTEGLKKHIDLRALHAVMGDEFYDIVSAGITKLNAWSEEHLDVKGKVDKCVSLLPAGKLSLKVRKTGD